MSLVCEISGEPLLGNNENEIVVTPSGHICIKRLLLTKLVENGGLDPFETIRQLPLSEDQLVTLQTGSNSTSVAAPPRPQATSLPNMLGLIQKEYDALVLELFDTRKALEETRRELSQALYQNDAAIRVVARVAQERDTVKQQLEQWNASSNAPTSTTDATATATAATGGDSAAAAKSTAEPSATVTTGGEEQPSAKRRRILEPTAEILENDLPDEDLKAMSEVWAQLNKVRKPTLKAAAAEALSPKTLGDCTFLEIKAWHKSTNRGIPSISSSHNSDSDSYLTVTAGKDKQLVVYNEVDQVVQHTFNFGLVATCVDIGKSLVVAGSVKGTISAFSVGGEGGSSKENTINVGSKVVDVCVHPTGQHVCAATVDGRVIVACWIAEEQRLQQIATFEATKEQKEGYTSAALHPDGLIYVAGTKTGKLHVWDFKNKVLAATLQVSLTNNMGNKTN
jgi:pre-mRNA-processing factor 19